MVSVIWVVERRLAPIESSPEASSNLQPPVIQCSAEEF